MTGVAAAVSLSIAGEPCALVQVIVCAEGLKMFTDL